MGFLPSIENLTSPILFKDPWMNFSNYFLCSLDFDFVMLDVLVVTLLDVAANNDGNLESRLMVGILVAYIVDSFLIFVRDYYGRRNLA